MASSDRFRNDAPVITAMSSAVLPRVVNDQETGDTVPGVPPAVPQPATVADWVTAIAESLGALGTAGALMIGLWILFRDHRNAERAQVDLVGAWIEPRYERRAPSLPRVEETSIQVYVRNGSELPVQVEQLEYVIRTRWLVPTDDGAWEPVDGTPAGPSSLRDFQVRPQQTWDNNGTPAEVNLAHTAPERAVQLDLLQGVRCEINSVVVVDNAGRRWETRPSGGGRAKPLETRNQGQPSGLRAALVRSRAYRFTAKIMARISTTMMARISTARNPPRAKRVSHASGVTAAARVGSGPASPRRRRRRGRR